MKHILVITRDPLVHFRQMPGGTGLTPDGRYQFHLNTMEGDPDYVVVMGKGLREPRTFSLPPQHTVLVTGEPYAILAYARGYCRQFGLVASCQPQLRGSNVVYTPALLPWFVGATFEPDGTNRFPMTYDDVARAQPEKTRAISVIASNKAFSPGHVDRIRFIRRLRDRYGDRIDIYGRGHNSFADKWDVLAPYRYHIVIENSTSDYYWTEKLADCYLAGTYPLYHGCRNIADYFPRQGLTPIDIRRFDECAAIIDRTLDSHLYERSQPLLRQCKELVLDKYNLFNQLAELCDRLPHGDRRADVTLQPASRYPNLHNLWLHTVGRNLHKLRAKL